MMKPFMSFCMFVLLTCFVAAQVKGQDIKIGEKLSIQSKILNEERPFWVYLPQSYYGKTHAPKSYPVMYLLDGSSHFHSASGVVQFMSSGINGNIQIPEMIIVGIPNTKRTRDLTPTHSLMGPEGKEDKFFASSGGGDTFLKFLQVELIPHIESKYRTAPYRLLVGHSFGGTFAIYAFEAAPTTFQAIIAIDPALWWDKQLLVNRGRALLAKSKTISNSVYLSLANSPAFEGVYNPESHAVPVRTFAELLEKSASRKLRSKFQYFAEEDHPSVPLLSLYHGLLFIFEGYKTPLTYVSKPPSELVARYKKVSEQLGFEVLPPEGLVNGFGYEWLFVPNAERAIEFFKLNVTLYPNSANVYDSLGEAYMVKGDKPSAIKNYEKSLELNPENQNAKNMLQKLKNE